MNQVQAEATAYHAKRRTCWAGVAAWPVPVREEVLTHSLASAIEALCHDPAGRSLSLPQLGVLFRLCSSPGPHTVRGLAARLRVGKGTVTRTLDVLSDLGLARRKPDPDDRRSVLAVPTPAGRELARRIAAALVV